MGKNGDWKKEGYKIGHKIDGDTITVSAHKDGKQVGELYAGKSTAHRGKLKALNLTVDSKHRRKGLATSMYNLAEKQMGQSFVEGVQSANAKKLWSQPNRPFGKSETSLEKMMMIGHGGMGAPGGLTGGAALTAESIEGAKPDKKKKVKKQIKELQERVEKAEKLSKPYRSEAQRRWAHTDAGEKALGGKKAVHEWDEATKGKKLPEKLDKAREDKMLPEDQRKEFRAQKRKMDGRDPLKGQETVVPGVSDVGIEIRRADKKVPENKVYSNGYARTQHPDKHLARAKDYLKELKTRLANTQNPKLKDK